MLTPDAGSRKPVVLLPGEEAAFAEDFFAEFVFQAIAQEEAGIGGVADAEFRDHFLIEAAAGQVFAGFRAFGTAKAFLKEGDGALVHIEQLAAEAGFLGFAGSGEAGLGERNSQLLRQQPDRFREGDVFDFLDEVEDVAFFVAAEAVVELLGGVHGKRRRFFPVKGTQAGVILSPGFAELDVVADNADDIRLLLYGVREIAGVRHGSVAVWRQNSRRNCELRNVCIDYTSWNLLRKNCGICGYPVEGLGKSGTY